MPFRTLRWEVSVVTQLVVRLRLETGRGWDLEDQIMLACPLDKQPVTRVGNYLVCQECQRHYPIREGIPVMLIDEALTPEQAAASPG